MEKYFTIDENNNSIKCKMYYKDLNNINDVIISCHGFCGSKENGTTKKLSNYILDRYDDIAIITFDWPCHGKDVRQKLHLSDCNDYLKTVINYIQNNFNVRNLYSNATSFGGYLTLKYIYENGNPFKKIVLRCPAVNMYHVLSENILTDEELENIYKNKIVFTGFEKKIRVTKELLEELKENDITKYNFDDYVDDILVVHGKKDELVSIKDVNDFCANKGISFIDIDGADHTFNNPAKLHEFILYATEFLFDESLNNTKRI